MNPSLNNVDSGPDYSLKKKKKKRLPQIFGVLFWRNRIAGCWEQTNGYSIA
jgi:hypothetical protein